MVDKKPLPLPLLQFGLPLLLLLLLLSCLLLPLGAVPSTRSLVSRNHEAEALQAAHDQVMESGERRRMVEELFARMDIESNDYPGSGANNRHDPKSPGRA